MRSKTKADETDAKILRRLLEDSRASFTSIAKECKISVNAVRVRYERLKKSGIINGATIEVNPYSFGFRCIADVGIITNTENEEGVNEELERKKYILVAKGMGKYNIMTLVVSSSTEEISDIVQHMESDPRIIRTDTFLWTNPTNIIHPENLVFKTLQPNNQAQVTKKQTKVKIDQPQIDETDINIAKILVQDSRTPFIKIAEQLGISTNMVIKRYNRLKEINVIIRSMITLNLNKLGYNAFAFIFIKIANKSEATEIYNQLLKIPNLLDVIRHIGIYDLRVLVPVADIKDVFDLKEHIRKIKGIEKGEISLHEIIFPWPMNFFSKLLWCQPVSSFPVKSEDT